jgi:hypothetical protein
MSNQIVASRVCAVCGSRQGDGIAGFATALRNAKGATLKAPDSHYAHPRCMARALNEAKLKATGKTLGEK